jgi:hypothetical protein
MTLARSRIRHLFPGGKHALLWAQRNRTMTLDEAKSFIRTCANQMNSRYGRTVFDEWAVVSLAENKARVLVYTARATTIS